MKFKIEIIIEGDEETRKDLEKGNILNAMTVDIFYDETILNFSFKEIKE